MKILSKYILEKLRIDRNLKIEKVNDIITNAIYKYLTETLHYEAFKDYKCENKENGVIEIKFIFPQDKFSFDNMADFLKRKLTEELSSVKSVTTDFKSNKDKIITIEYEES